MANSHHHQNNDKHRPPKPLARDYRSELSILDGNDDNDTSATRDYDDVAANNQQPSDDQFRQQLLALSKLNKQYDDDCDNIGDDGENLASTCKELDRKKRRSYAKDRRKLSVNCCFGSN